MNKKLTIEDFKDLHSKLLEDKIDLEMQRKKRFNDFLLGMGMNVDKFWENKNFYTAPDLIIISNDMKLTKDLEIKILKIFKQIIRSPYNEKNILFTWSSILNLNDFKSNRYI